MIRTGSHWLAALLMLGGVARLTPAAFAQRALPPDAEEYAVPAPGDDDDAGAMMDEDETTDTADTAGDSDEAPGPAISGGQREAMARCWERYRSFDPATDTYTTYDGEQRPCPYLR